MTRAILTMLVAALACARGVHAQHGHDDHDDHDDHEAEVHPWEWAGVFEMPTGAPSPVLIPQSTFCFVVVSTAVSTSQIRVYG